MSDNREFDTQNKPTQNDEEAVWDAVIADFKKRDDFGYKKYGTRLQPFNGRNSLQDSYEEACDLLVYLKQSTIERKQIILLLHEVSKVSSTTTEEKIEELSYRAFQLLRKMGET
jgi:hypothetical protein